mmetsp:Transcript_35081/g.91000  ORF Transcript_35081/g.91000 Transcript_35081/m.91000 type:complete len:235 (+) Transcript_35081:603-1307(+)
MRDRTRGDTVKNFSLIDFFAYLCATDRSQDRRDLVKEGTWLRSSISKLQSHLPASLCAFLLHLPPPTIASSIHSYLCCHSSLSPAPTFHSLSLSLSHTHTHTHSFSSYLGSLLTTLIASTEDSRRLTCDRYLSGSKRAVIVTSTFCNDASPSGVAIHLGKLLRKIVSTVTRRDNKRRGRRTRRCDRRFSRDCKSIYASYMLSSSFSCFSSVTSEGALFRAVKSLYISRHTSAIS